MERKFFLHDQNCGDYKLDIFKKSQWQRKKDGEKLSP